MSQLEEVFPGLKSSVYEITSVPDPGYNCIAWAAHDDSRWWEPDPFHLGYWPERATRTPTLSSFIEAFSTMGYERCESAHHELAFEKVVLFIDHEGSPTHAARQTESGRWASKLGQNVDIEHDLRALEGEKYGVVAVILKRPRKEPAA